MASINSQRAPSSIVTFLLGIVCLAVFALIIVVWTKMTAPKTDLVEAERGAARLQKRLELEKEWAGKLQTVAWINKEKGEVQVPIGEAMKVVALELKDKKVAKTEVKVPAPLPPPVIDPKSTEPPPLPLPSSPQGTNLIHFSDPFAAPATPAPVPATPAPAPSSPAPSTPAAPVTPPAAAPAPATPPTPAPAVPPAPAAEPKSVASSPAPSRPPLINWTESK